MSVLYTAPWSSELNPIEYVFSFWKSRVVVPPEVRELERILEYLSSSLRSIAGFEILRCVLHVEVKLFPLALRCEPLFLRRTVEQFRESNSEISYGCATTVIDSNDLSNEASNEEDLLSWEFQVHENDKDDNNEGDKR